MADEVGSSSTEQSPPADAQDVPEDSFICPEMNPFPISMCSGSAAGRSSGDPVDDEMTPFLDGTEMPVGDLRRHFEAGGTLSTRMSRFHRQSVGSEVSEQTSENEEDESAPSCCSPLSIRTCKSDGHTSSHEMESGAAELRRVLSAVLNPKKAEEIGEQTISCTQNGGTTADDFLSSAPIHPNRERSTASTSIDPARFCHRSVGVQTLPDDEYPSRFDSPPHTIDSPLIESEVPAEKKSTEGSPSEGILRMVIREFSSLSDTVRGPIKMVQDVGWRIMAMPRRNICQKKGTTQKGLGFFLQCCPNAYSDSWSCEASAELKLISQKAGVSNCSRKTNHVYTAKENDWGYSGFMTWADILDESQGYILNDTIILEVHLKAERPKNILSLDEFRKKIDDYIRVAQMQSERGFIDKAIDCNSRAIKFCNEKDAECSRRLRTQQEELVAQKLKQSIARIERGDPVKDKSPQASNMTALRMAMGGTPKGSRAKRAKETKPANKRRNSLPTVNNPEVEQPKAKNHSRNSSFASSDKEDEKENCGADRPLSDSCAELHSRERQCNMGMMTVAEMRKISDQLSHMKGPDFNFELEPESPLHNFVCETFRSMFSQTSSSQTDFPPQSDADHRLGPAGDSPPAEPIGNAGETERMCRRTSNLSQIDPFAEIPTASTSKSGGTSAGAQSVVSRADGSKKMSLSGPLSWVDAKGLSMKDGKLMCKGEFVVEGKIPLAMGDGDRLGFRLRMEAAVDPYTNGNFLSKEGENSVWKRYKNVLEDLHEFAFRFYTRICFEVNSDHYETLIGLVAPVMLCNLHHSLEWEETVFANCKRPLTKRADETKKNFQKRKARAAECAQLVEWFQQRKVEKKRQQFEGGRRSRSLSSSLPETTDHSVQQDKEYESLQRIAYHLYESTNRMGYLFATAIIQMQDHVGVLMKTPNIAQFPELIKMVVDFCERKHLGNRKTGNLTAPPIEKTDLPTITVKQALQMIFSAKSGHEILSHISALFGKVHHILTANNIQLKPLVDSIIKHVLQLEEKKAELQNEKDALLKDQKAWKKEKNQLLKAQKTEKSRLEAVKQECTDLRNVQKAQQKVQQKKEADLIKEVERLRMELENSKIAAKQTESRHARELQSLSDANRKQAKEAGDRQTAVQKLEEQLEERNSTVKKLEQSVQREKRQSQRMAERAKAAEIALLNERMDEAIRRLEETRTDCVSKIEQLEQRIDVGHLINAEIIRLKKDVGVLQKMRADIHNLIEETRAEGRKDVEQLKAGKQLSQMGRISFPKPPVMPSLDPLPPFRVPPPVLPPPTPAHNPMSRPPPSDFTPPGLQHPKFFDTPPPQSPAFCPLHSGPPVLGPSSHENIPPSFMPPNGSIQQQQMAPYFSSTQSMFMSNPVSSHPIPTTRTPAPIGTRLTAAARNGGTVDSIRALWEDDSQNRSANGIWSSQHWWMLEK